MKALSKIFAASAVALAVGAIAAPANAITYIAPWTGAPPSSIGLNFGDDRIGDASGAGVYYGGATAADGTSTHTWNSATGEFEDTFSFELPDGFVGFAGISIGFTSLSSLSFTSVTFNGVDLTRSDAPVGSGGNIANFFSATPFAVSAGSPMVLVVKGVGGANAQWDGSGTFMAAVPEPGTWALMIGGFMGAGAMLRRKRQVAALA